IVYIQISKISLHGIEDFRNGHAERFCPLAVYLSIEPRGTHTKIRIGSRDRRIFHSLGYKLLGDSGELRKIAPAGVLQLKRKTSGGAEARDRRCIKCKNQGLRDFGKFPESRRN